MGEGEGGTRRHTYSDSQAPPLPNPLPQGERGQNRAQPCFSKAPFDPQANILLRANGLLAKRTVLGLGRARPAPCDAGSSPTKSALGVLIDGRFWGVSR